jgi:hypothetical protein
MSTLLTGFGSEESFVREILNWYEPRVADPIGFACENRVLLVQAASGVGIDENSSNAASSSGSLGAIAQTP